MFQNASLQQTFKQLPNFVSVFIFRCGLKSKNRVKNSWCKKFLQLVHCIQQFPHSKSHATVLKVVQINGFFAHPENVLLGMLGDEDEEIRRLVVNKIQTLQEKSLQHTIPNGNFKAVYIKDYQNTEGTTSTECLKFQ